MGFVLKWTSHLTSKCSSAFAQWHFEGKTEEGEKEEKEAEEGGARSWQAVWHRVTQKELLCNNVLSVCVASIDSGFFFFLFYSFGPARWDRQSPSPDRRGHCWADGQMDRSIMSTPGGVLEGLWAGCSGYRTLKGEEEGGGRKDGLSWGWIQ